FIATAEVIALLGATPIFVDIAPQTYNIDPAQLEAAIGALKNQNASVHPLPTGATAHPLTPRGIIAVDLFGLCADYDALTAIAKKHGLFLIEDAAQSFGAEYRGKKACAFGDITCTSFFPAKPLGCYGDGGMCFTDDAALAAVLDSLRVHGKGTHKYDNARIGINGRLDTLQAAILLAKFEVFPDEVIKRQEVARYYTEALKEKTRLVPPEVPAGYISVWAQYSLLAEDEDERTAIMQRLGAAGIPTAIYYPKPLHLQTAFAYCGYKEGDFPVSEEIARRIFSIPMHPYLNEAEQARVVEALKS
ncbi:MAG: DegT/DnrJ/EryC1/StrS family aminotransferase, partial [Syntrophales bacterium]|nr:DegT/DnrJ/EryC1/StrS family aminotransferase [Syntrophales bacterium]